eukprot:CAMPEP_0116845284 /NCGR_PEP_ID=MMETSP0418-20121206/13175_1 /TAXON_ID=1158023 /ORGANISM="Astrosyne radiata, Strain 13vi08-1A" /LENGTH=51 /DNA_ID=CAMNT_0004476365 /DNA_START=322 /DNA_END=477 /DNA_ORIENTATION=+
MNFVVPTAMNSLRQSSPRRMENATGEFVEHSFDAAVQNALGSGFHQSCSTW